MEDTFIPSDENNWMISALQDKHSPDRWIAKHIDLVLLYPSQKLVQMSARTKSGVPMEIRFTDLSIADQVTNYINIINRVQSPNATTDGASSSSLLKAENHKFHRPILVENSAFKPSWHYTTIEQVKAAGFLSFSATLSVLPEDRFQEVVERAVLVEKQLWGSFPQFHAGRLFDCWNYLQRGLQGEKIQFSKIWPGIHFLLALTLWAGLFMARISQEFVRQRLLSPSLTRYYAYALTHGFEEGEDEADASRKPLQPGDAHSYMLTMVDSFIRATYTNSRKSNPHMHRFGRNRNPNGGNKQNKTSSLSKSNLPLLCSSCLWLGETSLYSCELCMSPIIPVLVVPGNIFLFFTLLLQNTSVFTRQSYLSVAVCIFILTMVLVSVDAEIMTQYKTLLSSVAEANFREVFSAVLRLGKSVMLFEKGAIIMSLVGDLFGLRIILTDGRWGYLPWKMYIARGLQRMAHHVMCDMEFSWLLFCCSFITTMIGVQSWNDASEIQLSTDIY